MIIKLEGLKIGSTSPLTLVGNDAISHLREPQLPLKGDITLVPCRVDISWYVQGGTNFGYNSVISAFVFDPKIQCYSTSLERFFVGDLKLVKGTRLAIAKHQNGGSPSMFAKKRASKFNDVVRGSPFEFLPGCVSVDGQKAQL